MSLSRDRTNLASSNLSRELLTHLDLSSVPYMDKMEAQSDNPTWAKQVELQNFQLLYTSPKEEKFNMQNKANDISNISFPYVEDINNLKSNISSLYMENINNINANINQPHGLDLLYIPYSE